MPFQSYPESTSVPESMLAGETESTQRHGAATHAPDAAEDSASPLPEQADSSTSDADGTEAGAASMRVRTDGRSAGFLDGTGIVPYYDRDGIVIICGRCEDVLPSIDPASVDLLLTDPPYGMDHDTDYTRFTKGADAKRSVHARVAGDDVDFDPTRLTFYRKSILFGANHFSDSLPAGSWLVWDKRSPGGSKNVMSDAEVAWCSHGRGVYIYAHAWDGFNRASERGTAYHPTQKPVSLMRWIVEKYSKPGDLVLDPYMGSGPVAQACHELGRRYIGIELVEDYCKVAVTRLRQQTLDLGGAA